MWREAHTEILLGCSVYFLFVWARADAIGPRSLFGVLGFRRSLPAWEASFFDVATLIAPCGKTCVKDIAVVKVPPPMGSVNYKAQCIVLSVQIGAFAGDSPLGVRKAYIFRWTLLNRRVYIGCVTSPYSLCPTDSAILNEILCDVEDFRISTLFSPIIRLWAVNDPQHLGSGKKARFAAPVNLGSRFPTHRESNTALTASLH
jgi:hypothetical protein